MVRGLTFTYLVFLTGFTSAHAGAEADDFALASVALPETMASLGDSISAGVLASYSRHDALRNPLTPLGIAVDFLALLQLRSAEPLEKRYLSWSTGLDSFRRVNSHAYRLKALNPRLKVFDGSMSGADSNVMLNTQVPQLLRWALANSKRGAPDYVTMLIGSNDICGSGLHDMTSPDQFQTNVETALRTLLANGRDNKILVVDIPAVDQVRNNEQSSVMRIKPFRSCGEVWQQVTYCKNVLRDYKPEYQAVFHDRVLLLNRILEDTVLRLRRDYGDRVRFAPTIYRNGVHPDDVSVDCFHPNVAGQRAISSNTWEQTWWLDPWAKHAEAPEHREKDYAYDPEWKTLAH